MPSCVHLCAAIRSATSSERVIDVASPMLLRGRLLVVEVPEAADRGADRDLRFVFALLLVPGDAHVFARPRRARRVVGRRRESRCRRRREEPGEVGKPAQAASPQEKVGALGAR